MQPGSDQWLERVTLRGPQTVAEIAHSTIEGLSLEDDDTRLTFCYACRLGIAGARNGTTDVRVLNRGVHAVNEAERKAAMRASIADYLLSDVDADDQEVVGDVCQEGLVVPR